jgi:hypothetical protein
MAKRVMVDVPNYPSNRGNVPTNRVELDEGLDPIIHPVPQKRNAIVEIFVGVFESIIVPMLKTLVQDALVAIIGAALGTTPQQGSRVNYNAINRKQNYQPSFRTPQKGAADVEEFLFATQADANYVLSRLFETVAEFGWVSVGDYYSMVGEQSSPVHQRYGWKSLDRARVVPSNGGYYIVLPAATYS